MDNSLSDLVLVVDESGSMCSLQSAVISSFNGFINEQKEGQGSACVTLYTFSDNVNKTLQACDVREVTPLSEKNYDPHGCTALLDAVGTAIDETGTRLAALPEEKRPGTVIVGIMTDGYENVSKTIHGRTLPTASATRRKNTTGTSCSSARMSRPLPPPRSSTSSARKAPSGKRAMQKRSPPSCPPKAAASAPAAMQP